MPKKPARAPQLNAGLVDKIQQMQSEMFKVQESLEAERITISAGENKEVMIAIDGRQRVHHLRLAPELAAPGQVEHLQELLVAAINAAIEQSQLRAAERLNSVTTNLNLPDL
jgi:hypothetical protein